jgi:hypothetical protein
MGSFIVFALVALFLIVALALVARWIGRTRGPGGP